MFAAAKPAAEARDLPGVDGIHFAVLIAAARRESGLGRRESGLRQVLNQLTWLI